VHLLLNATEAIAIVMSSSFVIYVCFIVVPYLRHRRAQSGKPELFDWHFVVPCRDEEAVIGDTIRYLRVTFPRAHVWVIDDDSDDATADIVRSADGAGFVHLVSRLGPHARTGKGDALNAGYRELRAWHDVGELPADDVIVVVVDADGRPAPDLLEVCAADHLFGDPDIGAVQVDVRMSNRNTPAPGVRRFQRWRRSLLVRMQDLEFSTAIAAIQMSRGYTGTISMGGNGQLTRLSALDSIAGPELRPWGGSLLEDFELGVHVLTAGWKTGFTVDTYVDQEALYSLRRFLAQRTRWGQGTMQCARYVPRIWRSQHVSTLGAAEMFYYLAQPWMQLFGTVVYPIPFILLGISAVQDGEQFWTWFSGGAWLVFAAYFVLGILPFLLWGPIYWLRHERRGSVLRGVAWGVAYSLYIYTFYVTTWRALVRLVRGRNGWAKTRRNAQVTEPGTAAIEQ
jgi:1,2-diacylglycerol 3-beta-glucosyltransferase